MMWPPARGAVKEVNMETVALAGLGRLGRGIAACLLAHGYKTLAWTPDPAEVAQTESTVEAALREMAAHGAIDTSRLHGWRDLWTPVATLAEFRPASFVIESIIENLQAKQSLYRELEAAIEAGTPIATNTSSLPVAQLQQQLRHPQRLIGMHWAQPAYATRFLEVIRGPVTDDATEAATRRLGLALGKEPCVVAIDLPGFVANRLGYAVYREALHLLQLGVADAETIDRCFRNAFGLWAAVCGPLRWIDMTGGPALYLTAMENVLPSLCDGQSAHALAAGVVDANAAGAGSGRGFYSYAPGEADRWVQLLREHAWQIRDLHDREFPLPPADGVTP
jgi:3-hydroxybutyryl-CoA dehydrogenase